MQAITGLVPPPASLTSEPASKASKHLSGTQHLEEKPKKPRKVKSAENNHCTEGEGVHGRVEDESYKINSYFMCVAFAFAFIS